MNFSSHTEQNYKNTWLRDVLLSNYKKRQPRRSLIPDKMYSNRETFQLYIG